MIYFNITVLETTQILETKVVDKSQCGTSHLNGTKLPPKGNKEDDVRLDNDFPIPKVSEEHLEWLFIEAWYNIYKYCIILPCPNVS